MPLRYRVPNGECRSATPNPKVMGNSYSFASRQTACRAAERRDDTVPLRGACCRLPHGNQHHANSQVSRTVRLRLPYAATRRIRKVQQDVQAARTYARDTCERRHPHPRTQGQCSPHPCSSRYYCCRSFSQSLPILRDGTEQHARQHACSMMTACSGTSQSWRVVAAVAGTMSGSRHRREDASTPASRLRNWHPPRFLSPCNRSALPCHPKDIRNFRTW